MHDREIKRSQVWRVCRRHGQAPAAKLNFTKGEVFHGGGNIRDTLGGCRYAAASAATRQRRQTNRQTDGRTSPSRNVHLRWRLDKVVEFRLFSDDFGGLAPSFSENTISTLVSLQR